MREADYANTVRFSIFVDPTNPKRAWSCVSESPSGSSPWSEVDLTKLYKPIEWEYPKLLYSLSKEDDDNNEAALIGKSIFSVVFSEEAKAKLSTAAGSSRRLAIDCQKELVGIPWELLHDSREFLSSLGWSIIRVARELAPDVAYFGPVTSVALITVAPNFDPTAHIDRLQKQFARLKLRTEICSEPDKRELRSFLSGLAVDALYFLGHGSQGRIQLRPSEADDGWLHARDLAQWLPDPKLSERQINLAYFASCSTAHPQAGESVFSGVAQRLMLSGRVGTVIAMQSMIELQDALKIADAFFDRLVKEGDPERALSLARTVPNRVAGQSIPVLYTHVRGPEAFRRNRISRFLGAAPDAKVCISLPGFEMGMKHDSYVSNKDQLEALLGDCFHYRGLTYAKSDVEAAKEFLDLLSSLGTLSNVEITGDDQLPDCPTTFVFGSKSHLRSAVIGNEYQAELRTSFGETDWTITDTQFGKEYVIRSPVLATNYEASDDFGYVEKVIKGDRSFFFVSGLGDRATRGCAYYIAKNWEKLLTEHLDLPFAELFVFPGGLPFTHGERLNRKNNPKGRPLTSL